MIIFKLFKFACCIKTNLITTVLLLFLFTGCNKTKTDVNKQLNETKSTEQNIIETDKANEELVYICTGAYATKYHLFFECSGFNNCSGDIELITKSQAIKQGKKICKKCYKK